MNQYASFESMTQTVLHWMTSYCTWIPILMIVKRYSMQSSLPDRGMPPWQYIPEDLNH